MKPITLFTWGYWGWGNATRKLARAVDSVEASRGFRPPMFVDIRISRKVQAKGFIDNAFQSVVGKSRYQWMNALGNSALENKRGPRVQIKDPSAAEKLLDLALEISEHKQRLIFFCSCEFPYREGHESACHRATVARLVLEAAHHRRLPLLVVEWPGGEPKAFDISVHSKDFDKVNRGSKSIPLGQHISIEEFAAIPWGSMAKVRSGDRELPLIVGPAKYRPGEWYLHLPVETADPNATFAHLQSQARHWRHKFGLDTRTAE